MKLSVTSFPIKVERYFSHILPTTEIAKYLLDNPSKYNQFVLDFEVAIATYNDFRHNSNFPNRELYINALELNTIYKKDLPKYSEIALANSVFVEIATDKYFQEVWQIRPIENLIINLLLLIYRTTILQNNKSILIDSSGHRLVQISSTIEEMVFALHIQKHYLSIYPALSIWLKDWQSEGFDKRLFDRVLK